MAEQLSPRQIIAATKLLISGYFAENMERIRGARGEKGADGKDGKDGRDGKIGPIGPKGERGLTGPKGNDGLDGPAGKDGRDGKDGPPGKDGQGKPGLYWAGEYAEGREYKKGAVVLHKDGVWTSLRDGVFVVPTSGKSWDIMLHSGAARRIASGGLGAQVAVGAGGNGTVTTVSVVTANGVSGSVANPTTTPAITLTLGAITPTSVAASGAVTGSNISGTNTGDQTITLTSDVTGSGTGSFATTIAAKAVTYAKIQDISATQRALGRNTAGSGSTEEVTIAQMLGWLSTTAYVVPFYNSGWTTLDHRLKLNSVGSGETLTIPSGYQALFGAAHTNSGSIVNSGSMHII